METGRSMLWGQVSERHPCWPATGRTGCRPHNGKGSNTGAAFEGLLVEHFDVGVQGIKVEVLDGFDFRVRLYGVTLKIVVAGANRLTRHPAPSLTPE